MKVYIEAMTNFEKISDKKFLYFNLKDFIFNKYICKATYIQYIRQSIQCRKSRL